MCDGDCSKRCLIFLNVLFFLAGAGVLGIGLWMKIDPMIVNYLQVVNINASDPLIDYAALVFIVVGAAAFVIALIGCCGAMRNSQGLLFVYIVLLLVLILGEVVGAVLALVYRGEVESTLLESMQIQVKEDYTGPESAGTDAWNYLQVKLECCGANNYTDFTNSYWWNNTRQIVNGTQEYVPMQCCQLSGGDYLNPHVSDFQQCQQDARDHYADSDVLNTKGCHEGLQDWFQQHSLIMMIIGFAVGAVQLLGIVCACNLRKSLRSGKYTA